MAGQDASKLRKGSKTGSVFGGLFKGSKKPATNGFVNPQGRKGKISDREMREFLKAQEREFLKAQERLKKAQGEKGRISEREIREWLKETELLLKKEQLKKERLKKAQGRKGKISDREMRRLGEDAARFADPGIAATVPATRGKRKGK